MSAPYQHFSWHISFYSGKTRAYLRYKNIPHVDKIVRLWDFARIKQHTGAVVMPVVVTPQGEWLQDTSHIIDVLESRHPAAPVVPHTPKQQFAAYLLEAWGDEFWVGPAMHYRWNFSENYTTQFRLEVGHQLLPFAPRFLKNKVADRIARTLRGFLPGIGVVPAQLPAIERWTEHMLDVLEAHFAAHDYLLGSKPCIGDFGLVGPLYAHLGRDPYPARTLIAPRRHLAAWVERMQNPPNPQGGAYFVNDEIPATLQPVFDSIFGEFWPLMRATLVEVQKAAPTLPPGRGFPRLLGRVQFGYAGESYTQRARNYSLWMAQRAFDAYHAMPREDQVRVQQWLAEVGAADALSLDIKPRLKRMALFVAPEPAA